MRVVTMRIDSTKFNAVLQQAVLASSRAAHIVVNNHAYAVAVAAAHACRIANKGRIRETLGAVEGQVTLTKTGKVPGAKWRQLVYIEGSLAERIIQKRRKDAGLELLHGDQLDARIRKMIIGRAATVGFIASGFVRAARRMRQFTKGIQLRETPAGIKVIPNGPGGTAIPASSVGGVVGSGVFIAKISNDVVSGGGRWQAKGMSFSPQSVAGVALIVGIEKERQNMKIHLASKLKGELTKAGVKTQ